MNNSQKIKFILLDLYTVLFFGLFLVNATGGRSLFFVLFFALVNISVSIVLILADKKELAVHFIVGKSKRKILLTYGKIDGLSILFTLLFFVFVALFFHKGSRLLLFFVTSLGFFIVKLFLIRSTIRRIL